MEQTTKPGLLPGDDGKELMLQVSAKNQLELISIADNKANVITALNTLLIFLIIALFSAGFTLKGSPALDQIEFALPLGILLLFCSISAICGILALKPKIIRSKEREGKSLLFFHNFYRKSLTQYKAELQQVMSSRESIYSQMITNMYNNGLVLERKYTLLGIAYTLFLLAIVCSVTAYVIVTIL